MLCDLITIKKGNDERIDFSFKSQNLNFTFQSGTLSVLPAVGDTYFYKDILFVVTSTTSNSVSLQSNVETASDVPVSGTITRADGSGDSSINYTSYSTNKYIDLTGSTYQLKIGSFYNSGVLPLAGSLLFGVFFINLSNAQTALFPAGTYSASLQIVNSAGQVTEFKTFQIQITEQNV